MSEHRADVRWKRATADFHYESYNRSHELRFKEGSLIVPGDAAPAFKGTGTSPDPEDFFVASLSACHMLSFLAIAARKRLVVDSYEDDAVGYLEKIDGGKLAVTRVRLRPRVVWSEGTTVNEVQLGQIHHLAHETCFIANSVKTDVIVEPQG